MRQTLDGFQGGLEIGQWMVTNLLYADDIILLATSDFGGRTTEVGGSSRPSQPQIHPIYQRRQDQGDGERWHSVPYTRSE